MIVAATRDLLLECIRECSAISDHEQPAWRSDWIGEIRVDGADRSCLAILPNTELHTHRHIPRDHVHFSGTDTEPSRPRDTTRGSNPARSV